MEHALATAWRWWLVLWPHVLAWSLLAINVLATAHAILLKRDTRSAIGWVGLIWLSPFFGVIAYGLLGVNRIRSRATQLLAGQRRIQHEMAGALPGPDRLDEAVGPDDSPLRSLAALVGEVTDRPLGRRRHARLGEQRVFSRRECSDHALTALSACLSSAS